MNNTKKKEITSHKGGKTAFLGGRVLPETNEKALNLARIYKVCGNCKKLVSYNSEYIVFGNAIMIIGLTKNIPVHIKAEAATMKSKCSCCGTLVEFGD